MKKVIELLQSRKFWALVLALSGLYFGHANGVSIEQTVTLAIGVIGSYIVGTGLERKEEPPAHIGPEIE